ncbi:hypothetical protein M409DRAFT_27700 [Zasmidium cellare ATCC 36951]|uniref:G domain-containing protein n=1 Tax=Zasmidium cellare ATCC 36951 TaxID=1080233 RepID=A0A6A6C4D2_ZASCE|nr:uncharacterized protein M409DRAFT_27700 [Zasmidium cellare ATCC 36951]KAF2161974.1 hypothetical protein M409DRAFT_27700 [Zasmidium cellare ATCC 36951]
MAAPNANSSYTGPNRTTQGSLYSSGNAPAAQGQGNLPVRLAPNPAAQAPGNFQYQSPQTFKPPAPLGSPYQLLPNSAARVSGKAPWALSPNSLSPALGAPPSRPLSNSAARPPGNIQYQLPQTFTPQAPLGSPYPLSPNSGARVSGNAPWGSSPNPAAIALGAAPNRPSSNFAVGAQVPTNAAYQVQPNAGYQVQPNSSVSVARAPIQKVRRVDIAVMGPTGSGKSTFIRAVSGNNNVIASRGMKSCTQEVANYTFCYKGYNVNLIDTPGFSDTYRSEPEVLDILSRWLRDSYKDHKLSGVIYFQPLPTKVVGSFLLNLSTFEQLCGPEPLKNVVLVGSHWDVMACYDKGTEEQRWSELVDEFWAEMIHGGASTRKLNCRDASSGLKVIELLLSNLPTPLQIQREMVEQGKAIIETGAGQVVNAELLKQERFYQKKIKSIAKEYRTADRQRQEQLCSQQQKVHDALNKLHDTRDELAAIGEENQQLKQEMVELKEKIQDAPDAEEMIRQIETLMRRLREERRLRRCDQVRMEGDIAKLRDMDRKAGSTWRSVRDFGLEIFKSLAPIGFTYLLGTGK